MKKPSPRRDHPAVTVMGRTKLKLPASIADAPEPYRVALAHWSAFRHLGFDAKDIFFGFGPVSGEDDCLHLQLQTQGKTFTISVARIPGAEQRDVFAIWQHIARLTSEASIEEIDANARRTVIGNQEYFTMLAVGIRDKGIIIPELARFETSAGSA